MIQPKLTIAEIMLIAGDRFALGAGIGFCCPAGHTIPLASGMIGKSAEEITRS